MASTNKQQFELRLRRQRLQANQNITEQHHNQIGWKQETDTSNPGTNYWNNWSTKVHQPPSTIIPTGTTELHRPPPTSWWLLNNKLEQSNYNTYIDKSTPTNYSNNPTQLSTLNITTPLAARYLRGGKCCIVKPRTGGVHTFSLVGRQGV